MASMLLVNSLNVLIILQSLFNNKWRNKNIVNVMTLLRLRKQNIK